MIRNSWNLLKETVTAFIADDALSRGAAIAFYATLALAPILVIIVAIAGLAFGEDAARSAVIHHLQTIFGNDSATLLRGAIRQTSKTSSGVIATIVGVVTLILTASGIFGEVQAALNVIWRAEPKGGFLRRLLRARATSLLLVLCTGLLLLLSLFTATLLIALTNYINTFLFVGTALLRWSDMGLSYLFLSILFAAIYKILPDAHLEWRDVAIGALGTSFLFQIGRFLITFYVGNFASTSRYGTAGALVVVLLWVYYSSQIFLLGAEFTKTFAVHFGSKKNEGVLGFR